MKHTKGDAADLAIANDLYSVVVAASGKDIIRRLLLLPSDTFRWIKLLEVLSSDANSR